MGYQLSWAMLGDKGEENFPSSPPAHICACLSLWGLVLGL